MVARVHATSKAPPKPAPKRAPAPAPAAGPAIAKDGLALSKRPPATPGQPAIGASFEVKGGKIRALDTVKLDADPERVLAALEDDWSRWWPKARVGEAPKGLPKPAENEKQFAFTPPGGPARAVRQSMAEAKPTGGAGGELMMVVGMKLSGEVGGSARYEVRATADGKTLLTSVWDDVEPVRKPAGPKADAVAKAHLASEAEGFAGLGTWLAANP